MSPSSNGERRKDVSVHQTVKSEEETRKAVLGLGNSQERRAGDKTLNSLLQMSICEELNGRSEENSCKVNSISA